MLIDAVRGLRLLVAAAEAQGAGGAGVLAAAALGLDCGETERVGTPSRRWFGRRCPHGRTVCELKPETFCW